ncbi:MAG: aspartate/glutamate racemase family protein, partial [Candidatus Aminicenantes bacterium]|nr:aspartate/glutamate racemase family protein [Candidatus Aminicenantes bacterium]
KLNAYKSVQLVFVNALFSTEGGYNSLKTPEEKRRILDSALRRMEELYHPDLLLIACNTLSILYPGTDFAQSASIPVLGIVDTGVEMMAEQLKPDPEARIILFGTQTTITENTHKKKLTQMGFLPDRIITQACPDLVPYIEKDHNSDETEMLILAYVDEALQKRGEHTSHLYVCFGCTHYGYSLELWQKAFNQMGVEVAGFINPNRGLAHIFDRPSLRDRFERTDLQTRVISMVPIPEEAVSSLGEWLLSRSPDISRALRQYEIIPDLFPWKPFVDKSRKIPIPRDDSLEDMADWE